MSLEKIARFKPGDNVSVYAQEDLEAGIFVEVTGVLASGLYKAKPAGANLAHPFGVTERQVKTTGLGEHDVDRTSNCARKGSVAKVLCEGEIKAGEEVYIAGAGKVKKIAAEKNAVGRALTTGENTWIEVDVY